ncbi:MAG: acyltransferase [Sedimentisphaerales bacterium]|nr:acyltransferase [Sedimentisphaerales bacterium]
MGGIGIRFILWRRLAAACGDNVSVHESVWLRWPQFLSLGRNVSIHPLCYLDAQGCITIGNDVSIAHNVSVLSFEHDIGDLNVPIKDAPCLPRPVVIEDDVWIGAGARILGGVRIGTGSVIGAGAVVTRDVPAYSLAVGVPARPIRSRRPGAPGAAASSDTGAETA